MIGILSFLLLFYLLCNAVLAQLVPEVPPPIVPETTGVDMLVDFGGIFNTLLEVFTGFLADYYGLLIGIFVAYLLWGYVQGIFESKKERLLREQAEQQAERVEQENRLRMVKKVEDKRLFRERELIRRYAGVDEEQALRMQNEMYRYESKGSNEKELGLAPLEDDNEVYSNNVSRADIFEDTSYLEDTATIRESSTVIMRDTQRNRIHRSMDDDDEYSGY
jgi:hypothetical protein